VADRSICTVVIDESYLFREGLSRILSKSRFRVVASYPSLDDLSASVACRGRAALILVGIDADYGSVLAGVRSIKEAHEHLRFVTLSSRFDPEQLVAAIESGVDCYLLKNQVSPEALLKSMDLIFMGGIVLPQTFTQFIRNQLRQQIEVVSDPGDTISQIQTWPAQAYSSETAYVDGSIKLSDKERSILWHLTQGASNKLIGRELQTAESTVKVHMKTILRKIRAKNRTQAALWAVHNTLLLNELQRNGSRGDHDRM
jgi:two-component system nitrate/nitrite response regulator NarL